MKKSINEFLKEKGYSENLSIEQKEDFGLLYFMEQADRNDTVDEEEILKILNK